MVSGVPVVAQWVKDLALFLQQHVFDPQPSRVGLGSDTATTVTQVAAVAQIPSLAQELLYATGMAEKGKGKKKKDKEWSRTV